jgi:hypothetical protein
MPDCITCGAYTKFQNGKCYECYSNSYETERVSNGLNGFEWERRYNMIKGRIAETLIQELFLSLGYKVFRYGMEHTVPGITKLLQGIRNDVSEQIRKMPDFVIQKDNSVFFVEVKFRANELFGLKDLEKNYPYDNAFIVLVSKKHIKCLSVTEIKNGKEITPQCQNYLGKERSLN